MVQATFMYERSLNWPGKHVNSKIGLFFQKDLQLFEPISSATEIVES